MKQNFSQKQTQKQTLTLTQTMKKSLDVLKMDQNWRFRIHLSNWTKAGTGIKS
ncbi:hypothetical protein [uncultured Dubosiella sp.]|uniref:hypothetical protein n=1 Tax=uncultured Dubosiella sp. TaxID=1937011 RepID=UPI0025B4589F|nr:hypothetical protein [uncultured Dubosiella sp.]